jgi:hydrogenase expression/formation protein HypC
MCLGIPGEVAAIRCEKGVRMADVRFAGIVREVCLECVPKAEVGDWVVVHVGFAISRIDPEEAARAYRALDIMGHTKELAADSKEGAPRTPEEGPP